MKARNESKLRNECNSYSAIDYERKITAQFKFPCIFLTYIFVIVEEKNEHFCQSIILNVKLNYEKFPIACAFIKLIEIFSADVY